jgi:aminoglycoside phosphotransferase family enzyme/predicted kinase
MPDSLPQALRALADPATYGSAAPVTVHETHASWVFVSEQRALKVKKPVALGFLDYGTLERRRHACEEEVRINRELAPGVYLGVRAIVKRDAGLALAPASAHGALEYGVEMRRVLERDTLAGVIAEGALRPAYMGAIAARLAGFHRGAPEVEGGDPVSLLEMWRRNLDELATAAGVAGSSAPTSRGFAPGFVRRHRTELEERRRRGMVRDGHGDLRCEHVIVRPRVGVLDRIEFDPALRCGDIAFDLSFLTMDLEAHGHAWAARELVERYRAVGLDPGSDQLLCFYGAHRALVRAKVAFIAASQRHAREREASLAQAREMWLLGERMCWRARSPLAVVICGLPATGKSTLAAALATRTGWEVVNSDTVRKRAAGLAPAESGPEELYDDAVTDHTYGLLAQAAVRGLRERRGVIVDATCRARSTRRPLLERVARSAETLAVRCVVPAEVALARAAARAGQPAQTSDADPRVVAELRESFEPLQELDPIRVLELDTRAPVEEQLRIVAAQADGLPAEPS